DFSARVQSRRSPNVRIADKLVPRLPRQFHARVPATENRVRLPCPDQKNGLVCPARERQTNRSVTTPPWRWRVMPIVDFMVSGRPECVSRRITLPTTQLLSQPNS